MDKQQAQTIIKEVFEESFNKDRFNVFIKNLFNQIEDAPFSYQGNYIPDTYKTFISRYERIGKYNDGEKRIDVLIVYLNRKTSIERARTSQRNFIAGYLDGRYGSDVGKDAALVAFVSPNEEDWRFSLVKMDYRFEQAENGKVKVKEEFTPARRWSFLVGKNESSHTAQSRLVPILADDEHNPTLTQMEEVFNIEKVTREFFEKYRDLFLRTKETLDKIVERDTKIKADLDAKGVDTIDFAKKLLGQIVFLYFLQKKGWFGVERDAEWGTGTKKFLKELFQGKYGQYGNFFNDILEPLFYEALRMDRRHDDNYYSRFNCKIPFLNGGLFDPIGGYDWVHTDILLPNELFSNQNKTKEGDTGNGILDIFDRYNFTVKEDEPLEKEVAVDPEMLGKVFENLLIVKDRKSKGTYYTPREIVHYMCQQSLINYLNTELNKGVTLYQNIGDIQTNAFGNEAKVGQLDLTVKYKSGPQIAKEDIETLIKYGEQVGENEVIVVSKGRETNTYSFKLPESIRKNAKLIDEKLASIKVCDPAIGSGAFPVGMMHEIVKTRNVLTAYINDPERTIYHFKRECIEKSLYGVDIDPGAVEIAKLRLWLSLMVDEEDIRQIRPLPNLDYKIVCGNSLLGYPYTPTGLEKIEKLKELFFNETRPKEKNELRQQIDHSIYNLFKNTEKSLGYKVNFDFEINFSEVFHKKGGFDVVIANPPYVRVDKIPLAQKKHFKKIFKSTVGKYDLYYLFIEKSSQLLKNKGELAFITPNKFCAASSAKVLREIILSVMGRGEIVSTSKLGVFEQAANYPVISILHKSQPGISFASREALSIDRLGDSTDSIYRLQHKQFKQLPKTIIPINISQEKIDIVLRLLKIYPRLSCLFSISEGLRIPVKYEQESKSDFRIVKQYQFERWTPIRKGTQVSSHHLYDVISKTSWRFEKILENKILVAEDALLITATLDEQKHVPQGGVYFGTVIEKKIDLKVILALLNSKLLSAIYQFLFSGMHMGGGYLRYRTSFLEELPIADVTNKETKIILSLVDRILAITKDEDYLHNPQKQSQLRALEWEIDQMVYQLYGLTDEEIRIVENS